MPSRFRLAVLSLRQSHGPGLPTPSGFRAGSSFLFKSSRRPPPVFCGEPERAYEGVPCHVPAVSVAEGCELARVFGDDGVLVASTLMVAVG
jgi:hypothetical protein